MVVGAVLAMWCFIAAQIRSTGLSWGLYFRAFDEQESGVVGQPLLGDLAVVGGAVVADDGHDGGVGVGGQEQVEEVAEHHGYVAD